MDISLYAEMAQLEADHWWFAGRRVILRMVLREFMPAREPRAILEVGAGTGGNLEMLSEFGEVWALEPNADARQRCVTRGTGATVLSGTVPGPALGRAFDLICLLDVLEHVRDHDAAVQWVDGHLREDGLVVITVPAFRFLWGAHDVIHHHRRYTASELEAVCRIWHRRRVTYFNTLLFAPIGFVRVIRRLWPQGDTSVGRSDASVVQPVINGLLRRIFAAERHVVRRGSLPFGVSILGIFQKATPTASGLCHEDS